MEKRSLIFPSIIIGFSIMIGLGVVGGFYYEAQKVQKRTIKVVGSATERFNSDIIKWDLTIQRWTSWDKLKDGYKEIAEDKTKFISFLISKGFESKDITIQAVQSYQTVTNENVVSGYSLSQQITLTSTKIDLVESIALEPTALISQGINFQYSTLNYIYSQIDSLKKNLLSSATQNAKERAFEIVKNADVKIGKLISAKSGVFQITRELSTDSDDYGVYDTSSRNKEIKVTVHTEFDLE